MTIDFGFESWMFIFLTALQPDYVVICDAASLNPVSTRSFCQPIDEFFDQVTSSCSRCSDICWQVQQRDLRRNNHCRLNCPDYYEQRLRHLSPPRLPTSRGKWTVTTMSSDHDDVIAQRDSVLMKPLFWISAVSLLISVLATVVIATICCRYPRSGGFPSTDRHPDMNVSEGKDKPNFYSNIAPDLTSTNNTKLVETPHSSRVVSSNCAYATVPRATEQFSTSAFANTAHVNSNALTSRLSVMSSASSSSSSSSPSRQKCIASDIPVRKHVNPILHYADVI